MTLLEVGELVRGASRQKERESFKEFLLWRSPEFNWSWPHLALMQEHLQAQAEGEIQNLMFLTPPQHGKSEQNTVRYTAWRLFREPSLRVAVAGYNQQHSNKFSRKGRRVLEGIIDLSDRQAVEEWETSAGGVWKSVGRGGGLTGNPVDLANIDDPIKDREEAESEIVREAAWEWYVDVVCTRIQPGGQKIFTYTPWHEDDLGSRILNSVESKNWHVVRLPALAEDRPRNVWIRRGCPEADPLGREPGEALCPERKTKGELELLRDLNPYGFQALYQCDPVMRGGSLFKVDLFGRALRVPEDSPSVLAFDQGSTVKGDRTACAQIWRQGNGRLLLDIAWVNMEPDERNRWERTQADSRRADLVVGPEDPGAAGKAEAKNFVRLMEGHNARAIRVSGDKETRATPLAAQVNAGLVDVLESDYRQDFINECRSFPNGKHDDMVDAAADAFNAFMDYRPVTVESRLEDEEEIDPVWGMPKSWT